MVDILDVLENHYDLPCTGTYRKTLKAMPALFDYDYVDAPSKQYGSIINNLMKDPSITTIKTTFSLGWRNKGYVVLQNELLYIIKAIKTIHGEQNKDVLRIMKNNPSTDYILSLTEMDNSMELK